MKKSRQIFILIMLFLSCGTFASTSDLNLTTELENYLTTQQATLAEKGFRSEFSIGNIDPRFNQKACANPLEFSMNRSPLTQANLTVLVECADNTPWKLYITTKFTVYGKVVYAATTIPRGHSIQAQDLQVKEEAINSSYYASFSDIEDVKNMIAKRSIRQGSIVQANFLQAPKLVKRGDDVVIMANTGSIMIKMRGTAMQDGELGQQISVKNNQSSRIVKAKVYESGLVSVTL